MEIKKIATLSESEFELLSKAGELAGSIKRSLEAKEIDSLNEESKNLISALAEVFEKISK